MSYRQNSSLEILTWQSVDILRSSNRNELDRNKILADRLYAVKSEYHLCDFEASDYIQTGSKQLQNFDSFWITPLISWSPCYITSKSVELNLFRSFFEKLQDMNFEISKVRFNILLVVPKIFKVSFLAGPSVFVICIVWGLKWAHTFNISFVIRKVTGYELWDFESPI